MESLKRGCDGYCGIMANYHPKLYSWLCENYEKYPKEAELVQAVIGNFGFTETGVAYPLSAKYHMNLCGIPTEVYARVRHSSDLTEYGKDCMKQMKLATDYIEKMIENLN